MNRVIKPLYCVDGRIRNENSQTNKRQTSGVINHCIKRAFHWLYGVFLSTKLSQAIYTASHIFLPSMEE